MRTQRMNDFGRVNPPSIWVTLVLIGLFQLNFILCWSLNDEGIALLKFRERVVNDPFGALSSWNEDIEEPNHCSWFGIECADGHVVSLNLKNLCLGGTLAPELQNLLHIRSIILRNNSFCGPIPKEISALKELQLLDLGYNNLSGPLPEEFGYSIPILLLDNNGLSCNAIPELAKTIILSEDQAWESHHMDTRSYKTFERTVGCFKRHNGLPRDAVHPRLLKEKSKEGNVSPPTTNSASSKSPQHSGSDSPSPPDINHPNSPSPPQHNTPPSPEHRGTRSLPPPQTPSSPQGSVSPPRSSIPTAKSPKKQLRKLIVIGAVGGFVGMILVIGVFLFIFLWTINKNTTTGPWATGLSGQLQKAFVTGNDRSDGLYSDKPSYVEGIPNLKRSELEIACEDFSNVIGSSSLGTIYKGTLSNGIEIAVISVAVTSAKDWPRSLDSQYRKKIETLSKVNHKNFVSLIGCCEEETPFTRMMVFEYAPNGTLFEHLHVREAEHLDWSMRLRIAMGMAYCLAHMHQLVPPITHPNLNSSAVNLSDDYAAKISDFCFWNEIAAAQVQPIGTGSLSISPSSTESNVYSFGLVLLEMMTGQIPLSVENSTLKDWVLDYLRGEQPLQDIVDPMLRHFKPEQLERISEVVKICLHPDPRLRPTMRDVAARVREITGIDRDKASPRPPLWWEELKARSVNGG